MEYDDFIHRHGLRMDRPTLLRTMDVPWSDGGKADDWSTTVYDNSGGKSMVFYTSSITEHEQCYIPELWDFIYSVWSLAVSECRTEQDEMCLDLFVQGLGVDTLNDLLKVEDF